MRSDAKLQGNRREEGRIDLPPKGLVFSRGDLCNSNSFRDYRICGRHYACQRLDCLLACFGLYFHPHNDVRHTSEFSLHISNHPEAKATFSVRQIISNYVCFILSATIPGQYNSSANYLRFNFYVRS